MRKLIPPPENWEENYSNPFCVSLFKPSMRPNKIFLSLFKNKVLDLSNGKVINLDLDLDGQNLSATLQFIQTGINYSFTRLNPNTFFLYDKKSVGIKELGDFYIRPFLPADTNPIKNLCVNSLVEILDLEIIFLNEKL